MTQRSLYRWTVLVLFFFAIGFTYEYHLPQIESFLLVKVEDISAKKAPVQVIPNKLRLTLFPLGVVLEDVKIIPKKSLDQFLAPTTLKEVAFGINLWSVIRGEIRLSRVIVRDSTITVFLKDEMFEKKGSGPAKKMNLDALKDVPIDEVDLENITFMGRMDPQGMVFRISQLDLDVVNLYNSLYLYFGSPSWQFKPAGPYPTLNLEAQGRGLLDSNEMRISALKVKSADSFLVASGLLSGDLGETQVSTGRFSLRTHLDLSDIANWVRVLPHPPQLPSLAGLLNLNAQIDYKGKNQKPELTLDFDSNGLQVDKFKIGDMTGQASATPDGVHADKITVKNSAGEASLHKVDFFWKPGIKFAGNLDIKQIELHELLENLGVHGVPVHVDVDSSIPCKGSYGSHLNVQCDGEMHGKALEVRNASGKKVIVKAKMFSAKGQVTVSEKDVRYKAEAQLGAKSKGRSEGVIDFDKGFQIKYQGDNVDFSDIDDLVQLKLEGSAQVKGSTEGNSDRATLAMTVKTKDFWLEDFGVGALTTSLAYKKGHLTMKGIEGQYGVSRYSGMVDIDLRNEQITAQSKLAFIDLKDLQSLLNRRLPIPVALSGTGTGQIKAFGPLDFNHLNYQVNSQFFRGTIAGENFDTLHFDIEAENGIAHTKRVQMTKANGQMEMRGILKPDPWTIDTVLVGRSLRLEQSEIFSSLGLDLQGQADFNLVTRGPIREPHVELNGRFSKVILADAPQDDSSFHLDFSNDHVTGSGQFLGNKVQTEFIYPLAPKVPFALELKTNNWDFTNAFTLISKAANKIDFETQLTMEAKLHSADGGFWNSSGLVEVKDFKVRHGSESMQNNGPMKLIFNKGSIISDNFSIAAGENFLRLNLPSFTREHLRADMNGKMDLSLLSLFTPFISDLRGKLALSVDLKGSMDKPVMSGSAFIENAYAKLRDFPHPFSDVHADLLFNQQSLLINAFRANLGGGKATAEGRLTFAGKGELPVDVKGSVSDVTLDFPPGYKTHGSGNIAIKGPRFPYDMVINYDISGGEVTSEFQGQQSTSTIKASPYLPKFVQQESFQPFRFDMSLDLKKPVTVSNSLIHAQMTGKMQAKGTPDNLLLNGSFSALPGGKVFFHETPFDISTGYVEYANFPPDNPRIYLTATTHVTQVVTDQQNMGAAAAGPVPGVIVVPRQSEDQYDVSLLVQGRAQPMPQITLTSQPPLSQRDIVSLLALGMTPTALDQQRGSGSAGAALGGLLQQPVGKRLKESLGVDLSVSTAPPTATDPTAAPMVTFSKPFTPKFSASASSTFGQTETSAVKLEYKLNHGTSLIGSWQDREESTTVFENNQKNVNPSIFGLDLEYKFQFK